MRPSRVKAALRRREPALVVTCHLTDPSVHELASLMGFHGIWLDLEHHPTSVETAAGLIRAARVGSADVIARPAKGEFMRLGRLLEAGAQGIIYPRCESAEEAAQVVRWAKFAPLGERGIDGANADNPYCVTPMPEYLTAANEQTLLVVQIESPAALEQAEAMARIDGVDVLFLGPGDFSALAGIPFQLDHPAVTGALERMGRAAAAAGKAWGTVSPDAEHSRRLLEAGARFIAHGADILIVKQGLERIQEEYARMGFTFDNRLASASAAREREK